ncbi:hypothetical protein [Pseudaestuariivita atlantica]|uniref:hypothetical protein n=1 Tax=Pseudaestuariivita atlantica TaxID=1317121 RepID=UPI0013F3C466|nr:hypothetical protein [Pseudaestuariivita atlantica]
MTQFLQSLADRCEKRARYNRIVSEIESMPLDVALDLDIYRGDAHRIARATVYGG